MRSCSELAPTCIKLASALNLDGEVIHTKTLDLELRQELKERHFPSALVLVAICRRYFEAQEDNLFALEFL
jgi:hypothetical protein